MMAGGLASCSDSYLDTKPETSIPSTDVVASTTAAKMAIYGLCSAMNTQYSGTSFNNYNGESYINTVCFETFGPDYISGLWMSSMGAEGFNWRMFENERWIFNAVPWNYCYNLVSQANAVLQGIDNAEGDALERKFLKAQALTFRAHAYTKLLQLYAPRWEDSNNGEKYCIVLRTEPGTGDIPLSKMNDVLELIYSDCDEAVKLYDESNGRRSNKWEPDKSVAYGVWARAAMIKHDWSTAQSAAKNARSGYTVMDANTYYAGFVNTNNDFIWNQGQDASDIYYWAFGSTYACNGRYVQSWGVGAGAISIDLYNQLDPDDIRRDLYLTPDKVEYTPADFNPDNMKPEDFWNPDWVDDTNILDVASGAAYANADQTAIRAAGLRPIAMYWILAEWQQINTANIDWEIYPYLGLDNTSNIPSNQADYYWQLGSNISGGPVTMPFGAQFKFWGSDIYGVSAYPYMRASEMCLTEAEAAFMAGDETTAKECLKEINSKRIASYSCTASGQALLDEIRLTRRIELWGEGFNWPDFKRWNLPCERRQWYAKNPKSGNWPSGYADSHATTDANGWRFTIPAAETDYNKAIDRSLLK